MSAKSAELEFWVIGDFVSNELKVLLYGVKVREGKEEKAGFLIDACPDIVSGIDWFPESFEEYKKRENIRFVPLVLCDERESLKKKGITCPYEFVIERRDLLPIVDDDGQCVSEPCETIKRRLRTLAGLYGDRPNGYFINPLKDWFAGAFRMYLMLDATTHGTSQYIDLELAKRGEDPILKVVAGLGDKSNEDVSKNADKLCKRFNGTGDDEVKEYESLARVLFHEYFCEDKKHSSIAAIVTEKVTDQSGKEEKLGALCKIYSDSEKILCAPNEVVSMCRFDVGTGCRRPRNHDERLPLAFGERAKYVTPSGKLNLLLIDDNVKESPFAHLEESDVAKAGFSASISPDDWELLREIFNVKLMSISKERGGIYETAVRKFRSFQTAGLTYDLILVDLCLGNNKRGEDLDGYAMIRIVKVFFPGTPIVVYSRFSDMEHIARAFFFNFNGAKWFLVKGEEAKLPRHVLKLLKQVGWHREWRAIENSTNAPNWDGDRSSSFFQKFMRTREWQYLTYKSLDYLPGHLITIQKMGGGISSAVTFKATKGVKLGEDHLQTPSIIKIDTSYNTMMEFERYFRMIRPYIANEAGRVEMPERVLNRKYSSIVYTFAGKQDKAHSLESMGDMLDDDVMCQTACDYETYRYAMQCIFDEILPKIHQVSPELELGDIGKLNVQTTDVKDAFEWESVYVRDNQGKRKSSFPNFYFIEFLPSEFWKSYMLRMQPWGRISVNVATGRLFVPQKNDEGDDDSKTDTPSRKHLIFHNVMTDPFVTLEQPRIGCTAGQRIIEAYTADRKLVWLDGDVCDFVARFRKLISPGTSLWFEQLDAIDEHNRLKDLDGRLEWLNDMFAYKGKKMPSAKTDFCLAIGHMCGLTCLLDEDMGFYTVLQDAVMKIAQQVKDRAGEWRMKCPIGIVHGDLNVKNIMLESRKHAPKENDLDVKKTVYDVWLIDFARTRRDLITHDFNVFFTSVLGELFSERLIGKEGKEKNERNEKYWNHLIYNFRVIVSDAVLPKSKGEKGVPDEIKDDRRFKLIYRILRRTHDAAMAAGVSQNMYLLTTALACLYTLKIFLNNGCKVRLAAAYFAAAWICYDLLCENIDVDNVMKDFKKPHNAA